ncbi:hypothetical protein ACVII0_006619 [Sinorhizobium meliloti]|uniref:hypothetical protein n=1 Tax=Rhizobium meliloti TaxID=382 RepID=UPI000FDBD1FF|nr:hypothetical protein [Sinorhizobium meliloti]RVH27058.1 hypothetical protein CN215_11795 [Sinorhizobium meliloti]
MPNVGKIRIGSRPEDVVILFDKGEPPLHVDLVTELAEEEDGEGLRKADIVARLRMKKETAWELCRALKDLDKPSGKARRP